MGMQPKRFFDECYRLRSQLVHGAYPRPSRELVDKTAAQLEVYVGDLIAVRLLDVEAEAEAYGCGGPLPGTGT
jgi:hypothetical protein